jgi:hypothetical protein
MLGASPQPLGIYRFGPSTGFAEWVGWLCANGSGSSCRRQQLCRAEPGTVWFKEPVDGISQKLGLLPSRALSSRETLEVLPGQAVVARLCEAFPCITAFARTERPDYRINASKREKFMEERPPPR